MGLTATTVQWRDVTFATGPDARYRALTVDGWEELPPNRYDKINRSRGHGSHSSPVWADERIVSVSGRCFSPTDRDRDLAELMARFTFDGGEEPLSITVAGRTLTAQAQLLRAAPILQAGQWGVGRFGWLAQWRCPDPLRYGPSQAAVSTGLPQAGGGLDWPLFGDGTLNWGDPGTPGQITLTNPGTAPAGIGFQVVGGSTVGLPKGWEVSADGQRITYPTATPAGQTIHVDTDAGTVLAEGTADRATNLTHADWLTVPRADPKTGKAGQLTLQFTSLGGELDPGARLVVPGFEAVYW